MRTDLQSVLKSDALFRTTDALFRTYANHVDLPVSTLYVLRSLYLLGEGCTQGDIARDASLSKQTVASCIRTLERDGIVRLGTAQGRTKPVELTENGRAFLSEKIVPIIEIERDAYQSIGEDQLILLFDLGETVLAHMQEGIDRALATIPRAPGPRRSTRTNSLE